MNTPRPISHEAAIELLPWLVNGSMNDDEARDVRAHAGTCVVCRRELEALQQLNRLVRDSAGSENIPAPDMRRINARIDEMIERKSRTMILGSWVRETFSSPWRLAFAAQTALVIVLVAALFWPQSPGPEFTTLTQAQELPDGHYVRVVFSPDMAISELAGLLDKMALTVAAGPSPRGVYTLQVSQAVSEDGRTRLLEDLQRRPDVLFAQWAVHSEN